LQPEGSPDEEGLNVSRKNPFTPVDRLCPRCLKPLQRGSRFGGWLIPQDYVCGSCGYRGTVFLEKDLDLNPTKSEES